MLNVNKVELEDMEHSNKEFKSYSDLLKAEKGLKKKLINAYKYHFSYQEELAELAFSFIEENKFKLDSAFRIVALFFVCKGIKTFRAIQLLTENGFGEDAAVLIRCQLELLINFLYMAKEDQKKRAEKYIYYCYILAKKYWDKLPDTSLFHKIIKEISKEKLKEMIKEYENHKKLYPDKRGWAGKSVEKMANDVGLKYEYIFIYSIYSNLVHSNVHSHNYYMEIKNDNPTYKIGITKNLVKTIMGENCGILLEILSHANDIFQTGYDNAIQDAINKYPNMFEN